MKYRMKYFLTYLLLSVCFFSVMLIGGCQRYKLYADPAPPTWWAGLSSLHAASRLVNYHILMLEKNNYQPELKKDTFDDAL